MILFPIVVFYSVENVRGWYALKTYRERCESQGEWFDLKDRAPIPKVPQQDNLLAYPVVIAALDEDDERFELNALNDLSYIPPLDETERPVIYSYGRNGIDDFGIAVRNQRKGDMVWRYEFPKGFTVEDFVNSNLP